MRPSLKTLFVMTALLLAASLGSAVAPRPAAAADVDVDISVFYTSLAPYGEWVQLDSYGWSWVPENVEYDWRPYTLGRWEWVEPYGWTWGSDEPFGWATYHYGRWTYLDDYGWVWVPGTTWGPAWVAFRYGDPWVGWAPLPPGSNWRFDAAFEVAGLNLDVSIGSFAWSFVPLRYFAEPDLRSRVFVTAYSPYFVERTRWSTRYAAIDGGYANFGVDLVIVEKARGSAVTRHRLREAAVLGSGARVSGGEVVLYRPRIAAKAPTHAPVPRARGDDGKGGDSEAWITSRRGALQARLEAQRKALEDTQDDGGFRGADPAKPGVAPDEESAKRRAAGLKALEVERQRLENLLERQRKRREKDRPQPTIQPTPKPDSKAPPAPPPAPPIPPAPPGMGDDGHGMDDGKHDGKDDGKGKKDEKEHGMK